MGYGLWGVNVTENESYGPKSGQRRLTSMSVIDSIFEMNNGIGAGYEPVKESTKWGRTSQYIDWIKSVSPEVGVLSEHAFNWSDKEYFMLQNIGKDGRYGYFPTNKNNNSNWVYLG